MSEADRDDSSDVETPGASLRHFLERLAEDAKAFTREKPVEGLVLSFMAGMILSDLLRRGR